MNVQFNLSDFHFVTLSSIKQQTNCISSAFNPWKLHSDKTQMQAKPTHLWRKDFKSSEIQTERTLISDEINFFFNVSIKICNSLQNGLEKLKSALNAIYKLTSENCTRSVSSLQTEMAFF